LERLFTLQRRFVGDVSHELRTPLTTIKGNLDLLQRYNDPKSISNISSEVDRMGRLVGDLLLLAQADAGQIPLEMTTFDLDALLLEIYEEAHILSNRKHQIHLGENFEQVRIRGDKDRLKQLLLNLVTNAIRYTPQGGSVTLSLAEKDGMIAASVSDTGQGIPPEDLKHIFDRFYRTDKARSRAAGGTGLGLSIVKWITEAHQGRLEVQSQEGKGTTFTVLLPKMPGEASPIPDEDEARPRFGNLRELSREFSKSTAR
jgi:signal transduction histidine kinase